MDPIYFMWIGQTPWLDVRFVSHPLMLPGFLLLGLFLNQFWFMWHKAYGTLPLEGLILRLLGRNAKKAPALPPGTGGQSGGSTEWLQDLQVIPTSRTDREREHARG